MYITVDEFENFLKKKSPTLLRMARKWVATPEDAVDSLAKASANALPSIPITLEKASLNSWFTGILRNTCLDIAKGPASRTSLESQMPVSGINSEPYSLDANQDTANIPADEQLLSNYDKRILQLAIGQLSTREREILYLRVEEEKTYEEIAETLQISRSSVGSGLARAQARLKGLVRELQARHSGLDDKAQNILIANRYASSVKAARDAAAYTPKF